MFFFNHQNDLIMLSYSNERSEEVIWILS